MNKTDKQLTNFIKETLKSKIAEGDILRFFYLDVDMDGDKVYSTKEETEVIHVEKLDNQLFAIRYWDNGRRQVLKPIEEWFHVYDSVIDVKRVKKENSLQM